MNTDIDNELRDKIREAIRKNREEKGLTQTQLGSYLGKGKTTVASWEQGRSIPDIVILYKMAKFFNKPIGHMYGEE